VPGTHLADLLHAALDVSYSDVRLEDEHGARFSARQLLELAAMLSAPLGISSIAVDAEHECSTVARIVACVLRGIAYVPVAPGETVSVAERRLLMGKTEAFNRRSGNIAYLMKTSGSTGEPKFVVQGYLESGYHAKAYAESIGLNGDDRIALLAALTTDASLMDMFGGIISGATVCMFDPRRHNWKKLSSWVQNQAITVLHMTPTLLRLAFELESRDNTRSIRCVVLGGEPATSRDLEIFRRAFQPGTILVNGYGPSECTTALQWRASHESSSIGGSLPLGTPIGATRCRIDAGELQLSGPGVFWGYHGRDDLNDRCFVKDESGTRWYRTGDLVEYVNGELLFRSRLDGRKKFKGTFSSDASLGESMKEHTCV
jgi:non-ribosomal peptide synthetase component F